MNLFYEPALSGNETEILLNEQESRHAIKVLRHKPGDKLLLTNGHGVFIDTLILSTTKKHCWLQISQVREAQEFGPYKHLIVAPLKNRNRMEWMLEKATEMGANAISIVNTHNTERTNVNHERVGRLLASAMKQSMRATLPLYQSFDSLSDCLTKIQDPGQRLIAECITPAKPHIAEVYHSGEAVHVLFGPEGDFTAAELSYAQEHSFQPVTLGSRRMRAETAPLAGLAVLDAFNAIALNSGSNFANE